MNGDRDKTHIFNPFPALLSNEFVTKTWIAPAEIKPLSLKALVFSNKATGLIQPERVF